MALNNTYFETKGRDITNPIPDTPGYIPPIVPIPPEPGSGSIPNIPRPTYTGAVSIQFYNNASDNDVLNKSISTVGSAVSVTIKDMIDLLDFTIPFNDDSLISVNYAYMLDRYYFVEPVIDAGNLTHLHFKVDALMSWKDQIKNQSAIIDRTASKYNTYLQDDNIKITAYNNIHRLESTGGFSKELKYYLVTIG